jgi:hypothetical protein
MKRKLTIAGLCAVVLLGLAMTMADPFESTKWKVTVTPDADTANSGQKPFEEMFYFKGGMFSTKTGEKKGFKPVQYDDNTVRFGPATFTAEPQSEQEGKAKWTGVVAANTIKGELVWTKKDGKVLSYSYTGERDDTK